VKLAICASQSGEAFLFLLSAERSVVARSVLEIRRGRGRMIPSRAECPFKNSQESRSAKKPLEAVLKLYFLIA
jgi:hypothetical protein